MNKRRKYGNSDVGLNTLLAEGEVFDEEGSRAVVGEDIS